MSSNTGLIRILVVDDHALMREGIAALIANQRDMRLVAEASTGAEAIERFRLIKPDITLMDMQMQGMSGIDAIIAIRSEWPTAKIIVLTTYAGDALAHRALRAGAQAYLLKGLVPKELLETVRLVHKGLKRIDPDVAEQLAIHVTDSGLSAREIEVLLLVALGNSNKSIATQLSITAETAKAHLSNIISKLHANDRTHAVTLAVQRGIIQL
jgi:DNA-binding NarL/FixJ family response regulator